MIRYMAFEIFLPNRDNNFYAPVTPSYSDQTQRKQRNRHKSHYALVTRNKGTEDMREQNTKAQEKNKNYKMIRTSYSPTHTLI